MNAKIAIPLFLAVCVILVCLLLFGAIAPIASAAVFALALVVFGGSSRGFRKKKSEESH